MVDVFNACIMRSRRCFNRSLFRSLIFVILDRYFVFYCCSWILIRYTRKLHLPIPLLNNWLTDFVFVPLIAHISFALGSVIFTTNGTFKYPLYQILSISLLSALVFEGFLPYYTDYNTADFYDVLAYFAGGVFYYAVHQNHASKKIRKTFEGKLSLSK